NLYDILPVADTFFAACVERLIADIRFAAIKVGVVASPAQVDTIRIAAERLAPIPLVVDPVLNAADGGKLADDPVGQALARELFKRATVITPNAAEARQLCNGEPDLDTCGKRLSQQAAYVLITGGDEPGDEVNNHLYADNQLLRSWQWPRHDGRFLGSGCTMASTLAARLGLGDAPLQAIDNAQRITWQALQHGLQV